MGSLLLVKRLTSKVLPPSHHTGYQGGFRAFDNQLDDASEKDYPFCSLRFKLRNNISLKKGQNKDRKWMYLTT